MSIASIYTIFAIAFGGALGAVSRHGVNKLAYHTIGNDFPYGTMIVNILGSFLMGLTIAIFAHFWQPSKYMHFFLITGFLGAFTTFSAFSLDVTTLFERGAYLLMGGYMAASVCLSILALFAGLALIKGIA